MLRDIRQTKFLLAAFILGVATLFAAGSMILQAMGKPVFLDASMWWAVALSIFTAYGGAHVVDTHLQQKKAIPPQSQTT
jgi:hypothetical protein